MSFGASPSDIIIVVTFCRSLYRKCRDAGGEYDEISREVRGLHTVLRHLKVEVEAPESPLNRDRSIWGRQLAPIIGDCDFTLRQLDGLLMKYGRLSNDRGGNSPSSPRILWDKIKFGSNEMDQLGGVRVKLISHKTSLTLFLDTIQLHQSGKMAMKLDNHGGQLDIILDKVDNIAARMTQKSGSVMTNYVDDDKEVWKQFRRELVAEGFSSDVLQQHKDVLRAYIREVDQKGLLNEISTDPQLPPHPIAPNTERWLESVQTAPSAQSASSENVPPSFGSLNLGTDDSGTKEMVIREDNMKFPQSMKLERPKPETRRDSFEKQRQLEIPNQNLAKERRRSSGSQRSPVTKLITTDEKQHYYLNTDDEHESSNSESEESDSSSKRRNKSPSNGQIIKTSDLIASSQALMIRPPGSPSSFKSGSSFFDEDIVPRSMAYRPKKQPQSELSPTNSSSGPIPIPASNSKNLNPNTERFGTSPRPEPVRLAPDAQGNEIPPDAKWTKINRRLVSLQVLDQDRRRYEARPDFVAVLGVLSRAEIQSLAARSQELRDARHRLHHPQPKPQEQEQAPPKPPRPSPSPNLQSKPQPIPQSQPRSQPRGGRDTPSTEDSYSSDSDHHRSHGRRPKYEERKTFPNYTHSPNTGYPNPFGKPVAPPSPAWSPVFASSQTLNPNQNQSRDVNQGRIWTQQSPHMQGGIHIPASPPNQQPTYYSPPSNPTSRDKGRDHSHRRRHSSPPPRSSRDIDRDVYKEKEKPKSRWKENLTAAGIGGAAASLLSVLTEAAEGL